MSESLPLFPLGSVPFPGLVLPLHVFEERYRTLVADLLARPEEDRRFGVVAILVGHEVGTGSAQRVADVGCVVEVREVESHEDGRYDLVATGTQRFRVETVDYSGAYPRADATLLDEREGEEAGAYVPGVCALFRRYCALLRSHGASVREPSELPDDPIQLSYLVGAAVILDLAERQRLLEAGDGQARLQHELVLLWREISVLRGLPSLPAYDFLSKEVSPN